MTSKTIGLALVLLLVGTAWASGESDSLPRDSAIAPVFKNVRIRQSVIDGSFIKNPAAIQYTHSGGNDDPDSYSIDVGVSYDATESEQWTVSPTVEYHRQTDIDKQQNDFQMGVTVRGSWDLSKSPAGLLVAPQIVAGYKWDKYTTGDAFDVKAAATMLYPSLAVGADRGPKALRVIWQPTAGLQYESAANIWETGRSGDMLRGMGSLEIALYPFGVRLRRNIELLGRITYWYYLERSGACKDIVPEDQRLYYSRLLVYVDNAQHIGIGLEYKNGENPEQGLQKQEVTSCALMMKF